MRRFSRALMPIMALVVGIGVLAGILAVIGYDLPASFAALWRGAFGSWYAFVSVTLVHATPLILLGVAFAVAARAGAINVGLEGQFTAGAIAAVWVGTLPRLSQTVVAMPLLLAAGMCAGALWVAFPVILRVRYAVTEVVSTLLLNFVAAALVSWLITGPLQEPTHAYPESAPIAAAARLPHLGHSRLHAGFGLVLLLALAAWWMLHRTRLGFLLRAAGEGPRALATIARVDPGPVLGLALLGSGALGGLGGAMEVSGVSGALYQNLSPGYGFTAIAVALLGRLDPAGVIWAGLAFGALEAGAGAMQRDAGVTNVAVQVVEAVVILVMVVLTRRRDE